LRNIVWTSLACVRTWLSKPSLNCELAPAPGPFADQHPEPSLSIVLNPRE
jgi:hypothetical protein